MANTRAEEGAAVVLLARREEQLNTAVAAIEQNGGTAHSLVADLSVRESIPDVARRAFECFGNIHIVVNAAGVNLREPVNEISLQSWDTTLDLNLAVPFFLARELVPGMGRAGNHCYWQLYLYYARSKIAADKLHTGAYGSLDWLQERPLSKG